MANTIPTVCAMSKTLPCKKNLRLCGARDLEKAVAMKHNSAKEKQSLFTNDKSLGGYKQMRGGLLAFRKTLKPHSYEPCGVLNTGLGSVLNFLCRP
jgi:hypothetical protein